MKYEAKYQSKKPGKAKPDKPVKKPKKPGNKNKKTVLIVTLVLAVCAAGCGLWYYLGHSNSDPVFVYPFQNIGMTEYWGDSQESYGPVTTDKIQTVFLTDTQIVTEVCVKEGDAVKKGDLLMTFDTTLDDLALERKRLEVEKLKLELTDAKEQLKELNDMKPMEPPDLTPPTLPDAKPGEVQAVPTIFGDAVHNGETAANPLIYWTGEETWLSNNVLRNLLLRAAKEQGGTATEIPEFPELLDPFGPPEETVPETTAPKPTEETVPETTEETIPETTAEPTTAPTTEPTTAPTTEPTTEPTSESTSEPTSEPDAVPSESVSEDQNAASNASALPPSEGEETQKPSTVVGAPIDHFFFILKSTQGNQKYGVPTAWQGIEIQVAPLGFSFRLFDASGIPDFSITPEEGDGNLSDFPGLDFGSGMTGAQLAQMRSEQQKKIKDLDFQIKMAEADYKIMQTEISDGNVYSTIDGSVISALTEEDARKQQQPILKVSGGGGFYVEGTVNELEKERMEIGQEVDVNDWRGGGTYKGVVRSIGDFPSRDDSWNGMGNPLASYYPFRIFVDESADLQAGDYVSVVYSAGSSQNGIYLENAFIRTEKGRSYVMVKGPDGRLEKRSVTTGKSLWGSYTEVFGQIAPEDMLAFPYGKNVKPGALTLAGEMSDLYG